MNTRKLRILSVLLPLFLLIQGIPVIAQAADDNILIYYNFDGNINDSSGNGNDGSIGGTVAYEAGYSDEAIRLNGSGWVSLPQNMILNNTSFTISMRFKTSGSGGLFGYQNADVGTGEGVCTEYVPVLSVRSDGKLYAEMWTGSSMTVISTQIVNDNEWHRVVMTSGTNSIRVYLDGVDIGGATGTPRHLSMNINQVGTNAGWGRTGLPPAFTWNGFTGLIDDFIFYSNAQSAGEIAKQTQTISFDVLPTKTLGSAEFELTATASSGLSVTYTSSNSAVATISGSTVTLHGVGTTEIAANQSGSETYSAAPQVVRTLKVIDTPQVTTSTPSTVTENSAVLGGNITSDGGDTVTGRGVVYSSTDNTPTIGEFGVIQDANGSGTGSFSESIGSLTSSTKYYICAYATNSAGTSYGSVMEFTTSAPPDTTVPAVSDKTIASSGITQTGVTLGWNKAIDETSAQAVLQYLVYQSSSDNLDSVTNIEANGTALGSYAADIAAKGITDLTAGTTYYFNLIVKDEAGNKTCYNAKSVTTLVPAGSGSSGGPSTHSAPKIAAMSVSGVTISGATLAGRVVSTGGALVTKRGFILSTSPNPVLGAGDSIIIPAGGGTGSFTAAADSLLPATTYYARVHAVSAAGTSYGATLSFTTGYIGDGTSAIPKTGGDAAQWPFLLCGAAIATAVGLVVLRRRERRG